MRYYQQSISAATNTRRRPPLLFLTLFGAMAALACGGQGAREGAGGPPQDGKVPGCDVAAARRVVETFGERLKNVPLLAPDSIVTAALRANYSGLVTEHLLDGWLFRPETAPGREASSPWPERIEIDSVSTEGVGTCRVQGKIIYLTSMEVTHGGTEAVRPVALTVQQVDGDGWQISSYEVTTPARGVPGGGAAGTAAPGMSSPGITPMPGMPATPPENMPMMASPTNDSTSPAAAAEVIRRYYAAIDAGEFQRAYELWGDSGRASGQSYQEFAAGFAETASVVAEVGAPGRVEGAAGSRFVTVPVVIRAVLKNGTRQRFEGTYTLRRVVVEGAPPAAWRWHIFSAEIRQVQ